MNSIKNIKLYNVLTMYSMGMAAVRLATAKKKSTEAGWRLEEKNFKKSISKKPIITKKYIILYLVLVSTKWFQKKKKLVYLKHDKHRINKKVTTNIHFKKIVYFSFLNGLILFNLSVLSGFTR